MDALPWRLVGADDLEGLIDEDVVRPVDADMVDFVLAVAQLHNTVDDAPARRRLRALRLERQGASPEDGHRDSRAAHHAHLAA